MSATAQSTDVQAREWSRSRGARQAAASANTPLRVLFVDSLLERGGVGIALLSLLQNLDRGRIIPLYVSLRVGQGDMPGRVRALGVPVFEIPSAGFRRLANTAQCIRTLRSIIESNSIDLVVSNSGHPHLYARPAAWLAGRPAVWWVHGYDPGDAFRALPIAILQQCLGADRLIANSSFTASRLKEGFRDRYPISVVWPGINTDEFRPALLEGQFVRRVLGLPDEDFLLGVFGRLQRWKGQHVVLQAVSHLAARGLRIHVLIAGDTMYGIEPEYASELKEIVRKRGLASRVHFLGNRPDVNALMNASDVVIHSSIQPEPFGLVVAEAMSAGRPVIASAAGGPCEMIQHRRNGFLVPPGNDASLASAIEMLLRSPEERTAMGKRARQHALLAFCAKRLADQMMGELEAVAKRPS